MMQSQWPGLGPTFDLSSLDDGDGFAGETAFRAGGTFRAQQPDAVGRPWWTCGTAGCYGNTAGNPLGSVFGSPSASGAGMFGMLSGLIGMLQQLVSAFLNQTQHPAQQTRSPLPGGPQQRFENVDVSSTGDPHISEVGTREGRGGGRAVDAHWDSMTSHDDLVHSNQIDGGYRVSTAVTAPGANGVTLNQSATVHANWDQDAITMNRDGSYAIFDDGAQVQLGKGESATLSGGEVVTVNQDGSLAVSASDGRAGTIATTLRSTGAGVDVTTHAHELALGGDAIDHDAPATQPPHRAHGPHAPHGPHS